MLQVVWKDLHSTTAVKHSFYISFIIGLTAFPLSAQIDSGGGKARVGSLTKKLIINSQ
jgi:hypothetical protein